MTRGEGPAVDRAEQEERGEACPEAAEESGCAVLDAAVPARGRRQLRHGTNRHAALSDRLALGFQAGQSCLVLGDLADHRRSVTVDRHDSRPFTLVPFDLTAKLGQLVEQLGSPFGESRVAKSGPHQLAPSAPHLLPLGLQGRLARLEPTGRLPHQWMLIAHASTEHRYDEAILLERLDEHRKARIGRKKILLRRRRDVERIHRSILRGCGALDRSTKVLDLLDPLLQLRDPLDDGGQHLARLKRSELGLSHHAFTLGIQVRESSPRIGEQRPNLLHRPGVARLGVGSIDPEVRFDHRVDRGLRQATILGGVLDADEVRAPNDLDIEARLKGRLGVFAEGGKMGLQLIALQRIRDHPRVPHELGLRPDERSEVLKRRGLRGLHDEDRQFGLDLHQPSGGVGDRRHAESDHRHGEPEDRPCGDRPLPATMHAVAEERPQIDAGLLRSSLRVRPELAFEHLDLIHRWTPSLRARERVPRPRSRTPVLECSRVATPTALEPTRSTAIPP